MIEAMLLIDRVVNLPNSIIIVYTWWILFYRFETCIHSWKRDSPLFILFYIVLATQIPLSVVIGTWPECCSVWILIWRLLLRKLVWPSPWKYIGLKSTSHRLLSRRYRFNLKGIRNSNHKIDFWFEFVPIPSTRIFIFRFWN